MKIKDRPEDFYVREIIDLNKKRPGNKYRYFILKKKKLTTIKAIKIVARLFGISKKRIYFAGEKDKDTVSEQYICIANLDNFKEEYELENLHLKYVGSYDDPLRISDIEKNYFRIVIREVNDHERNKFLENINIYRNFFYNYFDEQRFGNRLNNHIVGKYIIKRDYENAVRVILTDYKNEKNRKAIEARKFLENNWGNFKEALKIYPNFLDIERSILNALIKYNDYKKSLKYIHKRLLKMFVHAYQSYIWNRTLSEYIRLYFGNKKYIMIANERFYISDTMVDINIPTIGYDMILKDDEISRIIKDILDEENIKLEELKNEEKPSLSLLSQNRKSVEKVENLNYKIDKDLVIVEFYLGKGSFATTYIKHLFS